MDPGTLRLSLVFEMIYYSVIWLRVLGLSYEEESGLISEVENRKVIDKLNFQFCSESRPFNGGWRGRSQGSNHLFLFKLLDIPNHPEVPIYNQHFLCSLISC